jgi:hypothetical protein
MYYMDMYAWPIVAMIMWYNNILPTFVAIVVHHQWPIDPIHCITNIIIVTVTIFSV